MSFENHYTKIKGSYFERCSQNVSKCIKKETNEIFVAKKFQQKEIFEREVKINQMLNNTFVPKIIDKFEDENIIIFEDCGNDLFSIVEKNRITESSLLKMLKGVLQCIINMHKHNIFHGDIKLENIVTKDKSKAFLIDFGLSEILENNGKSSKKYGSTFYVAPESLSKQKHGLKADIYALGVTMFIALTGELPFEGNTIYEYQISQITSEPNIQQLQNANVSDKLIKIISKMLEKTPEKRPTAEECFRLIY